MMTVGKYREQLQDQLDQLKEFTNASIVQFTSNTYSSRLPSIDTVKMAYDETHAKAKYRAVSEDGAFATWGIHKILESNSIEDLSSSIACYYYRSPFELRVQDNPNSKWRKPTAYEKKLFDKELDGAFQLDELH